LLRAEEDQEVMIYDNTGRRKYLTLTERRAFIEASSLLPPEARAFCLVLAYTGARISEILALAPERIDIDAGIIIIECLKKRRRGIFRSVPIPEFLLRELDDILQLTARLHTSQQKERIWLVSRTTAWKWVKLAMADAGVGMAQAMPKALRHSFGVCAIQKSVPLNMVQKWMGHARLSTTALYADATGEEEQSIALRMWR
jgi:integrase